MKTPSGEPGEREAARELGSAFKSVIAATRRMRGRETRSDGTLSDAQYGLLLEERRSRIAPRWHAALQPYSDDELRTAAAVLTSLRAMFDDLTVR